MTRSAHPPLITIGITAYRESAWLEECWQSVVAQTDPRWEAVLVLDGGGDEETRRIFERIEHSQLRKIAYQKNVGPYEARRIAIEAAQTGWYAHLDADDRLPPLAVEIILDAIETNPEIGYVFGGCLYFGGGQCRLNQIGSIDIEQLTEGPIINGQSPIQVALFHRVGGFAPELASGGADWDFWAGVFESGAKGIRAGGTIYERRIHGDSVGTRRELGRVEVAETIIRRHPDFFAPEERRRRCLGKAHEQVALAYRSRGKRREAGPHARKAMEYGFESMRLEEIVRESEMTWWRYRLRCLGGLISKR
jgi:glycosyltransferase involved in cell wall biosynthesis